MPSYTVQLIFDDGSNEYTFPLLQSVSDPVEGMKATVIEGNRADGCIVIPSGKRSVEIIVKGILFDETGYAGLTTKIAEMRSEISTNVATLTLKHFDGTWVTDWAKTVRRINEINFPNSEDLRTETQNYEVTFLIISY